MKVYIHGKLTRSLSEKKLINVKMDVKSARLSGDRFYLGAICKNRHPATKHDGEVINYSLRYTSNCSCVACDSYSKKRFRPEEQDIRSADARRCIEDIKLAKELGVDIDDL